MKYNPKVVSFDRSAAYVHARAMKNRRDNNPIDALELMRQAVAQAPDNAEYRLDLAEMLCEMGCHEQSNRILLDMLAGTDAPDECYYGLALNQLGANELESARRALAIYRRKTNDDGIFTEAGNLVHEIDLYEALNRPSDRRLGRALQIAGKACDALRSEDYPKALRLFERSLEIKDDQHEMRALYAVALKFSGDEARALQEVRRSISVPEPGVRTLCAAAQVMKLCGMEAEGLELVRRAMAERPFGPELRLLILTMGEMGMHAEAADGLRLALRETPHDRTLLHMRAVALHKSGADDAQAASYWNRILRIDPEDSIAEFYRDAANQGRLDRCEPDYSYQVPGSEYRMRLIWIAEQLSQGMDHALDLWRSDKRFRRLLVWAVGTGNESCGRAAIMVIASAGDDESESLIRQLLYKNDIPMLVKFHALVFLRMRNADMAKLLPPDADLQDGLMPEPAGLLEEMSVGERQLVRFVDEVLSQHYQVEARSALALMWRAYRAQLRGGRDVLVSTQEAAAALAWNYLLMHGRKASPGKLAHQFGCKPRRMIFYARRMAAVLDTNEGETDDENH